MELRICPCGREHWNANQLCDFCAEDRHEALELRLRDDNKPSWMTVAAAVVFGERERPERRWRIA